MAPDLINRFLGGKPAVSEETVGIAKETAASYEGKKPDIKSIKQLPYRIK